MYSALNLNIKRSKRENSQRNYLFTYYSTFSYIQEFRDIWVFVAKSWSSGPVSQICNAYFEVVWNLWITCGCIFFSFWKISWTITVMMMCVFCFLNLLLLMSVVSSNIQLTHFWPMVLFCASWKHQKNFGLLVSSRGVKW